MLQRTLLALCVFCLAAAAPRAQYDGLHDLGGRVAPDAQVISSADGTLTLDVRERDGGPMNSKSSSTVNLRRGGKEVWSRDFDLAVQHAGVANRGWCTIVGIGRGEFASDRLRLVTLMMNPAGEVVMEEARTLVAQNHPHGTQLPRCAGVVVLESQDAMLVRLLLDGPRGFYSEEWRVIDARGAHDATASVGAGLSEDVCRWFGSPVIGESAGVGLTFRRGEAVERFSFLAIDAEGAVTLRRPGEEGESPRGAGASPDEDR